MKAIAPSFLVAVFLALACDRAAETDPVIDPIIDSQLVAVDRSAPFTRFDGGSGSILLDAGWAPPKEVRKRGELVSFAWALNKRSTLWFERPRNSPVDFVGNCMPFSFEGAPRQKVTFFLGGRQIGSRSLDEGWQEVRIPLPDDALAAGLNQLDLSFAYARRPLRVLPESKDRRRLAIGCEYLAVVPREVRDVEAWLGATLLDPSRRHLRLAVGSRVAFPLPASREVNLHLGAVRGDCGNCQLMIELVGRSGDDVIWRGAPGSAADRVLSFRTENDGLSRLAIVLADSEDDAFDPDRSIELRLPPDFLAIGRQLPEAAAYANVFIYLIDTLRADALAPYGGDPEVSPQIAAFARDAVVYSNTWSASSWTLPSVVSILTGKYAFRHHIMHGDHKLSNDGVPTLAGIFSAAGYHTVGISQSYVASSRFGVDTGFDRFFLNDQLNGRQLRSQELRRFLLAALLDRTIPEAPIFAYLHSVAPHAPYSPVGRDSRFADRVPGELSNEEYLPSRFMADDLGSDPREVAHLRALYLGEVAYADRQFGRFVGMLRHLDLYDDSLIVLLSDHGEEFGEHDGFDHGRTVYQEMLRIPLIVKYPGSRWGGRVIDERVSAVDVLPTVLRSAEVDTEELAFDGTSLHPPHLAGRSATRRVVFAEVSPAGSAQRQAVNYRTLALDDLKCIESLGETDQFGHPIPHWQTFDLGTDPGETAPIPAGELAAERCRGIMERWLATQERDRSDDLPLVEEEALEQLRALGYIE